MSITSPRLQHKVENDGQRLTISVLPLPNVLGLIRIGLVENLSRTRNPDASPNWKILHSAVGSTVRSN